MSAFSHATTAVLTCWLLVACSTSGDGNETPLRDAAADEAGRPDAGSGDAAPGAACTVKAPTACPDPAPRYADVRPIFDKRCVGCHDGSHEEWPLTSYQHVADWYGEIRGQMLVCGMPPPASGLSMPDSERELILAWIRCGFPK